jgi:hypothetical protein
VGFEGRLSVVVTVEMKEAVWEVVLCTEREMRDMSGSWYAIFW